MEHKRYRGLIAGSLALLLASCSGGSAALPTGVSNAGAPATTNAHHKRVPVRVRLVIPAHHGRNRHERHERFIAASTLGMQLQSYPAGSVHSSSNVLSTQVANVSKSSTNCTTNPNSSRTCSFTVDLYPGDLVVTTWDTAPVNGAIPSGANELAADDDVGGIKAGQANALSLTLGGVVSSINLVLPNPSTGGVEPTQYIHGTIPSSWTVGLSGLDAAGNVILTDNFADASGDPLPIVLALTVTGTNCGSGTISLGGSTGGANLTIAKPVATGVQFAYGATSLAAQMTGTANCSFGLHASAGTSVNSYGEFTLTGPKIIEYTGPAGVSPVEIGSGPDGNIYFTDSVAGKLYQYQLASQTFGSTAAASAPESLSSGASGSADVWFGEDGGIQPMSTTTLTAGTLEHNGGFMGPAYGIALGPDGNEWFTDYAANAVGKINTLGTITEYTGLTSGAKPKGIAVGSDGNLWFAECGVQKIGRVTTAGTVTEFSLTAYTRPVSVASGPDGALWIGAGLGVNGGLLRFDPTGLTQTDAIPVPYITRVAGGPDGAVWFTTNGNVIGRIPAKTGENASNIEYFTIPTSGTRAYGITLGPDGNVWFTEFNSGKIGEVLW